MKKEYMNEIKVKEMEKRLGCTFCNDGVFAEMSMDVADYTEKTSPIERVTYGFYAGDRQKLRELVATVDTDWCQYFGDDTPVFCGYIDGQVASFCIVDIDADCIISAPGIKIGSIGCVGTVPEYRGRGIGLRMVDLATLLVKNENCHKGYISYTHIENWYAKLGYQTFARFSFFNKQENFEEEYKKFWNEFGGARKMVLSTSLKDHVTSRMMSIVAMDEKLYFQTDCTFRKYNQLNGNCNVALCADNIQMEGIATEIGHPTESVDFCNAYKNSFSSSFARYSSLENERLFVVEPTFIEKWLYIDGVPYMETFDIKNKKYLLQQYKGARQ